MQDSAAAIRYDASVNGMRIVKIALHGYEATLTCNTMLGHCTVQASCENPLSPDIVLKDGGFAMLYQHTAVTAETENMFEESYRAAKAFCQNAPAVLNRARAAIEDGASREKLEQIIA